MKRITKEVKIAFVAIASLVILFFGLQFLKGLNIFTNEDTYYVEFEDIRGLTKTSAIFADGYKIGSVTNLQFDYGKGKKTIATIKIDNNMRIPMGTTAEIESDLLGNISVNLLLTNNFRERMNPGDTLIGRKHVGAIDKVSDMVPAIERMLPKLDSIMSSLNTLLADPSLTNTLRNAEDITANLTKTTQEMNTLMSTVNKDLPRLMEHTTNTMENADKITSSLANIDFENTMRRVDATLANVYAMTESLNNKQGTLGLLLHDPSLYNNLTTTINSADSLLIDLKSHPKRYVHFSIFGRKDK